MNKRMVLALSAAAALVAAPSLAQPREVIASIRIHGNHTTPSADVLALSGLAHGDPASQERLAEAERRLRESGRFAAVELRRRFASLDDASSILVVIVVDEHEAVSDENLVPDRIDRLLAASVWLPILSHADGYGFTYGARVTVVDPLGPGSRISVPLTWGGHRRAALEVERLFDGPLPIVRASLAVTRRVNPHFALADVRQEARVDAERAFASWLRVGLGAQLAQVGFGPQYDARHAAAGIRATIDTRLDPSFPRNAVHARIAWERLHWSAGPTDPRVVGAGAGRRTADLRGYVGLFGAPVLALRGQMTTSTAPVPLAEQVLVGGSDSLRAYRAGHRAGDNAAAASVELRVPLTSPLGGSRFGVKAFVDAAAAWSAGERLRAQRFDRGAGGGVYAGIAAVVADVDVAWPEEGKPRVHVGLGVSF